MQRSTRLTLAWLPALLYMLLIWWLSSQQVALPIEIFPWRDKGVHFVEYAALGTCFAHAVALTWPGRAFRGALSAWLFATGFGLLDELHQAFVPGRSADIEDLAADGLGTLAGIIFVLIFRAHLARRATRSETASE